MIREIHDHAEIFASEEYDAMMNGFEDDFYDFNGWVNFTLIGNAILIVNSEGSMWLQYHADENAAATAFNTYAASRDH